MTQQGELPHSFVPSHPASQGEHNVPRFHSQRERDPMSAERKQGTNDDAVRATDEDASMSRLSAASLGYINDPWAQYFTRGAPLRRSPIINRGTYTRATAIDQIIDAFLASPNVSNRPCQILSLGAGSDTRYFRYRPRLKGNKYFEIDFIENMMKKAAYIRRHAREGAHCNPGDSSCQDGSCRHFFDEPFTLDQMAGVLNSGSYCLISGDLRKWDSVFEKLSSHGFDTSLPTLVLSEFVLVYLEKAHSDVILSWVSQNLQNAIFVDYTAIQPDDMFGRTMIKNLKTRDIEIPGVFISPTVQDNINRVESIIEGSKATAVTMCGYWDNHVPNEEKKRLSKVEIFDEVEEWNLIGEHYCFVVCIRGIHVSEMLVPLSSTPSLN